VRVRIILLVSLVLNVALAVGLVTWMSSASNSRPRVVRPPNAAVINARPIPILKTNVLIRPQFFTWRSVESQDYAVYVENLRALGMPSTTIRDIIVADVDQVFAKRRREEAAKQDVEWWRSTPSFEAQSNTLARAEALEAERSALLTKLLGEDWNKGQADQQAAPLVLTGPVLGNLTDDVKATVQDIAKRSAERLREHFTEAETNGLAPNAIELAKAREETRQQLAAILSPQQLEEFLLRYSENANRLRRELTGLNATPEEFRSLFRAIDAIDREIQLRYSGDDAASQRARNALEQQRLAAIRGTLGTDRFEAYQTVRDPAYREALAVAQQAGGDENAALALYEINRATTDELNRIRIDPSLTEAQKQQQLQQAELEQQRARALVLGEPLPQETAASAAPPPPQFRPHVIAPFETLGLLSLRYGVNLSALREANPGVDINRVRPGTVINIPLPQNLPPSIFPPGAVPR
jgi:LysM repeat protein